MATIQQLAQKAIDLDEKNLIAYLGEYYNILLALTVELKDDENINEHPIAVYLASGICSFTDYCLESTTKADKLCFEVEKLAAGSKLQYQINEAKKIIDCQDMSWIEKYESIFIDLGNEFELINELIIEDFDNNINYHIKNFPYEKECEFYIKEFKKYLDKK